MHSHHHHHHHQQQRQQQAMYAQQQQQQANMLFYQYNQLQSMHGTYSNPALTSIRYDQLVPQASSNGSTPVQQPIQRSSPVNMISGSSPKAWMHAQTLRNPEVFLPIIRTVSNPKLDAPPYVGTSGNLGSTTTTTTPPVLISFESPRSNHRQHSKQHHQQQRRRQRRQRLHSGSSCYESDSPVMSSNDEEESEVRNNNNTTEKCLYVRS